VLSMPVRELVSVKPPNHLTPSQLIVTSCIAYVKWNTPTHSHKTEPPLTHPFKSKECQTLSWKTTHKYNCQRRDAIHEDDDAQSAREEKIFTAWLNAWTVPLCGAALAALDLANHKSDYLSNHWCAPRPS